MLQKAIFHFLMVFFQYKPWIQRDHTQILRNSQMQQRLCLSSGININQYNQIVLNHYDQEYCINQSKQLYQNIKTFLGAEDINDQLLVYQTTKLYKRQIHDHNGSNSSVRLLEDNQESCFDNSTKTFYVQIKQINTTSTVTPNSLQADLKYINTIVQKMILKKTDFDDQILQDGVFLDERIYQRKEAILDFLSVFVLLIDDIFLKIFTATISSNQDKEQIINLVEELFSLIEKISMQVNIQARVNGPQLIINGQILKWQLSKITNVILNNQFNIERDLLDGLINFVQKEQIELNYNYLNQSQELQAQLQTFFNLTTLEINQKTYKKTNLQNHLYNNRSIDQNTIKQYIIDMFISPYCKEQVQKQKLQSYDCVNINQDGQFYKCDVLTQEIDNKTVQVSCKCEKLRSIFLIQRLNNSIMQQNATSNSYSEYKVDNSELKLNEQPILLFHGIFIAFSFYLYFELISIENKSKQAKKINRIDSDQSVDETLRQEKAQILHVFQEISLYSNYPSNFFMNSILIKSYLFLQLSIKISMLIPFSFLEIELLDQNTIYAVSIINCGIFLLIRMILKIFQSIYRFGGKCYLISTNTYHLLSEIHSLINEMLKGPLHNKFININYFIRLAHFILCHFGSNYDILKNNYFQANPSLNQKLNDQSIEVTCVLFCQALQVG